MTDEQDKEMIIAEARAEVNFGLFGLVTAPLWLLLSFHERARGYSYIESLIICAQDLMREPLFLGILGVLELLMVVSCLKMRKQKLQLTDKSILVQTGLFRTETEELQLADIKLIYIKTDKSLLSRKMGVASICIETSAGEKKSFGIMKNARKLVDKANYRIATLKKLT